MKLCASESFSCSWLSLKPTFVGSLFPQQWLSVVVVVVVARVSLWTRWRLRWLRWKSGDEGMEKGRGERRGKGSGREGREKGESMEFWLAYYILTVAPVVSPPLKLTKLLRLNWTGKSALRRTRGTLHISNEQ